jgi:hypothetical protein
MTIITKGMGAILKAAKKRKTLTISGPKKKWKNPLTGHPKGSKADLIERIRSLPKKIGGKDIKSFGSGPKKPSKTKLSDTWQDRRIDAINRKIKKYPGPRSYIAEDYAQEASDIYTSKAKTKKEYKTGKK